MGPDDTSEGAYASDDVCTLMPIEPGVAAPIVKPLIVTVNAELASMVAPDVVSTTVVLPVSPHVIFTPGTLLAPAATTGVTEGAKNLGGYESVKEPPERIWFEKPRMFKVTETLTFPAMRSKISMSNDNLGCNLCKLTFVTSGALKVSPLCITASSIDGLTAGALELSVTTISTADTTLQLVETVPSWNRALHACPVVNGLPITVTETADASRSWGVTLMMTGAWASRSGMA